uniref:Uncharacterized protein n=1 Tax=Rhizophora mucronata TaxID=61149 RepID=A0A2P2NXW1_RHIMU
MCAFQAYSTQ